MRNLRKAINDALMRSTGYHLTKSRPVTPGPPPWVKREREERRRQHSDLLDALRAQAVSLESVGASLESVGAKVNQVAKANQVAKIKKPAAPPAGFPPDYDKDVREIIEAVRPYTMTANDKLHAMIAATRYVQRHHVPGAIVECGVWRGGSIHAAVRVLEDAGDTSRDLYLFDTYEGMSEPTEKDTRHDGTPASDLLAANDKDQKVWAYASLEDVQKGFEQFSYPSERLHFVKGKVEETVPEQAPDQIAVLRLDTDWYESTAHEFEHLYPRLVSGGVLLIDDYGWWQGSRQATDEFLERTGERLLLLRMDTGRIAVKP